MLCGIALKRALVSTLVLALGLTDWLELVVVSLLLVCASAAPLIAANTAAATSVICVRIMRVSSCRPTREPTAAFVPIAHAKIFRRRHHSRPERDEPTTPAPRHRR